MRFKRSVSSETVLGIPASFPPQQGTCAYCIKIAGQRKGTAQPRSRRATEAYSPNVVEGVFSEVSLLASFPDQGPVCALDAPRPVLEGPQDLPPLGGVDHVGHRPRAEDEVGAGLPRTVHDLVGV